MTTARTVRVDDPYTGEIACAVPVAAPDEAASALALALEIQPRFARAPLRERAALVLAFADALASAREEVAREITRAMGKPIRESLREVELAAERARALASLAEEALADRRAAGLRGEDRLVSCEPLGVVLQLAPWNEPLLATVEVAVPAVLAGNAVLVKPSWRAPQSGERLASAFARAGAPPGLVQSLVLDRETIAALMGRAEVALVAFAGPAAAAREVHRAASACVRRVRLEVLGRESAYVAEDADLGRAAEAIALGAFGNAGQGRASVQRVYVHGAVEEPFLEHLVAAAARFVPGDPMDESTTLGPLAEPELPGIACRAIAEARAHDGLVLCGGAREAPARRGRFYPATVVAAAGHDMTLMTERILAPVAGVARVDGDRDAVALMSIGAAALTASVWTRSEERALSLGRALPVAAVRHNHCGSTDAEPPFPELTRPKSFHLRRGG